MLTLRRLVEEREGVGTFDVQTDRPATVSIADAATGVTALAEVRP